MTIFDTYVTDLDGTLCDTLEANVAAYHKAFTDVELAFDENAYRDNFGHRFDEMMNLIAPAATEEQRQLVAERKTVHYAQSAHLVAINDNLVEVLRHAKANGAKIGLATTAKRSNASTILHHFSLDDLFDVAIFGEDVTRSKPDPECYQLALERLQSKPENTIIFEDSVIGTEAARKTGAFVIKVAL